MRHACVQDREAGTARAALQALAHIVLSVESVGLIEMLMELLSSGDPHLVSEVLTLQTSLSHDYVISRHCLPTLITIRELSCVIEERICCCDKRPKLTTGDVA
jgi:hypothetical protein